MKQLFLDCMDGMSDAEVRKYIADEWNDSNEYGDKKKPAIEHMLKELNEYEILIACVENYGYEEGAFFLIKKKSDGKLFEIHGGHCSCYGFEGQWSPEETTEEYLLSDKFNAGVYLDHKKEIISFMADLLTPNVTDEEK